VQPIDSHQDGGRATIRRSNRVQKAARLKAMNPSHLNKDYHHTGSLGELSLQKQLGTRDRAENFYDRQVLDRLNEPMRDFIARQEMVFVATSDAKGNCDCSLRSGLPGFVRTIDQRSIVYPEYRGNGVLASLGNIHENPKIGLMFVDFYRDTVGLHVNGSARIVENDELAALPGVPEQVLRDLSVTSGRKPERWVLVEVQEAYIHCSKHIPLLTKMDKQIAWGTDDFRLKGGDYFGIQRARAT
jgi:predicted pyridoxine 5'-phosphate oxidase superfamily flavin-nucleotide-binding protein